MHVKTKAALICTSLQPDRDVTKSGAGTSAGVYCQFREMIWRKFIISLSRDCGKMSEENTFNECKSLGHEKPLGLE